MKNLPVIGRDVLGVAGAVCLCVGASMAWTPAGLMLAGALMLAAAWRLSQ